MNGAEALIGTAVAAGLEVCFANPGTTELELVRAVDTVGGVRPVLGLFEGVCSGAADGYARMVGRPALVLLHLGPGLANAGANLHNAAKAGTPVVALVGDHATGHRGLGAPLESDIERIAGSFSSWVRTAASSRTLAQDGAEAIAAAMSSPGGVATLVVPADSGWGPADGPRAPAAPRAAGRVPDDTVERTAVALLAGGSCALLLGGGALRGRGLEAAGRVAAATGATLFCPTFPALVERGGGLPAVRRLPYFPEEATAALAAADLLVLAGAPAPVAFFRYPELPSAIAPPGMPVEVLAAPGYDAADALERLAERLAAPPRRATAPASAAPPAPAGSGPLESQSAATVVAALQPAGAIVVDEALTLSALYFDAARDAAPHTYLALTGGAIGQGLPTAVGAAIACPDRSVLALQADGSGLYTLQALWTMARERLNVTTLILANRRYRILEVELARAGATPGGAAAALTQLSDPAPDWVALAAGMGVPGSRARTADELATQLHSALGRPGPQLIEVVL